MDLVVLPLALLVALASSIASISQWVVKLRAHEDIIKSRDAQIARLQEDLKAKDIVIENLKLFTYADVVKNLRAQKELLELAAVEIGRASCRERVYMSDVEVS